MTIDSALMGQLNQLKGLILQVKQNTDSLSTALPEVDFCCDMFDRSDKALLDGYWNANGAANWTIRNNILVQQSPVVIDQLAAGAVAGAGYLVTKTPALTNTGLTQFSTVRLSNDAGLFYAANMTSADMIVEIGFSVSAQVFNSNLAVGQTYGVCVSTNGLRLYGVDVFETYNPGGNVLPARVLEVAKLTDTYGVTDIFASPTGESTFGTPELTPVNPSTTHVGQNTLRLVANEDTFFVYTNGSLWVEKTIAIIPGRNRVGILAGVMNQLGALLLLGADYTGITSFKAWPIGMPEPLDQTGHGVYVENAIKYTDKYHDSDGNYNPEA